MPTRMKDLNYTKLVLTKILRQQNHSSRWANLPLAKSRLAECEEQIN